MADKNFWDATGYWAGAGSSKRQLDDKINEVSASVRDFMNADPDGSTDCLPAFQECAEYLIAKGGGWMLVPGTTYANRYVFSAPLVTSSLTGANSGCIGIVGVPGRDTFGAIIEGNFAGGIIENHYPNFTLRQLRNLRLSNIHARGRGVIFNRSQVGIIEQCEIYARLIGIQCNNENYNIIVRNSIIHGAGNWGIGILTTQMSVENCSIVGWDVGLRSYNFGFGIRSGRFEVNKTGWQLGINVTCIFEAHNDGGNMVVTTVHEGRFDIEDIANPNAASIVGNLLIGRWAVKSDHTSGMPYILSQVSGTPGLEGTYTVSHALRNSGTELFIAGRNSNLAAPSCDDIQTERCNVGVEVYGVSSADLKAIGVSGTVGVGRDISTTSWSGGVATVNTTEPHYLATGEKVMIEGNSVSGYNNYPTAVAVTVIDDDTFTYPLAGDPGGPGSGGQFSPEIQYGVRIRSVTGGSIRAITVSDTCEQAGIDLFCDGNANHYGCHLAAIFNTSAWIDPPANMRANWSFDNLSCLREKFELGWNDLPGGSNSTIGPIQGVEYKVNNVNTTSTGSNVTGTGSSGPYIVKRTDSGWLRVA